MPFVWETAAVLYERTGRFGEAAKAYRKLATLDRRFLSNYLTQIAELEMRLGNTAAALAAGEELLAAAPGNTENYRFFAGLCMQSGQTERGLEVLRRSVRNNPNDHEALTLLAKSLADEFQTDEAIELYWRAFDVAADIDGKIPTIEALTELYLRTNRFQMLLDRLDVMSREESKTRDGTLWIAAAHKAAGDLGMTRQLLEQLVREDSRDTGLLEQLVDLSKIEYDFESATEFQKRLVAISPSPEREYLLATLLMELGELDEAEGLWMKLSQRGRGSNDFLTSVNNLLNKQQFELAAKLGERALQMDPENWELTVPLMTAYARLDQWETSSEIAEKVLAMKVNSNEPTRKFRETIAKQLTQQRPMSAPSPAAMLGDLSLTVQYVPQIRASLSPNSSDPFGYSGLQFSAYTPNCFADVRAVASVVDFLAIRDEAQQRETVATSTATALASGTVDELWQAVLLNVAANSRSLSAASQNADSDVNKCLNRLVELRDVGAANLMASSLYSQRISTMQQNSTPFMEAELDQLQRLYDVISQNASSNTRSYIPYWMADEFRRAGKTELADSIVSAQLKAASDPMQLAAAASMSMRVLFYGRIDPAQAKQTIASSLELLTRALNAIDANPTTSQNIGSLAAQLLPAICEYGQMDDAIKLVDAVLTQQARLTAAMRPSQREQLVSQAASATTYSVRVGGRSQRFSVAFPPASGYFGAASITACHALIEAAKKNGKLPEVQAAFESWVAEKSDDPYLNFSRLMAKAAAEAWTERPTAALKTIADMDSLSLGTQFVSLLQARMRYDSGDVRGALETIENLRPSNQKMLVDRELTLLTLVLQLGDLDRAKQSAQRLFALRLDSDTEFKLADLMYQLGMKELGERMMGRIRRRSGGKQDTLVQLMTRYSSANELDSAAEIARQVIRRTRPASSENYRTNESVQHEQALQILVRAKQIQPLIEQLEKQVARSPKSVPLIDQLAAAYDVAGRREDAQKLRVQAAEALPHDPRNLLAAAQQLTASGAFDKAADMYVQAVRKSPGVLNDAYYEMRTAFAKNQTWPKMVDMIVEEGAGKFQQSYRLGEMFNELMRAKQQESANKLFRAVVKDSDWYTLSSLFENGARQDELKLDDDILELITQKLCDASVDTNNVSYLNTIDNKGVPSGATNFLVKLVGNSDQHLKRIQSELTKQLEANPKSLFPRVVLCLLHCQHNEIAAARALVKPLIDTKTADSRAAQALWVIAGQLVDKDKSPQLAREIMESIESLSAQDLGWGSFSFDSSPQNLLVTAYENCGETERAKDQLLKVMSNLKVDNSQDTYNPGYGAYQYVYSLEGLSRRFLTINCPAEAFIAYRKAFANTALLDVAGRYMSNWQSREASLKSIVDSKLTNEVVLQLLQAATMDDKKSGAASYLSAVEIIGNGVADTRIAIPLEQFVERVKSNATLKSAVEKWLKQQPLPVSGHVSTLVVRLVIANAVDDAGLSSELATQLLQWASQNQPPVSEVAGSSASGRLSASSEASSAQADELTSALTDELAWAIVARNLPLDAQFAEAKVTLLQRAMNAAVSLNNSSVAFDLRCQVARAVAGNDKARARELFMQALDDLLPVNAAN